MTNYVKKGATLTLTAPYALLSGGGFKVGNIFAIAATDADNAATVEGSVEGVFDVTKDTSSFAMGDLVYWDDSAKKATSTVGSNLLIGQCEVAALTGGTTVRTRLFGVPGFSGQANGLKVAHALYDFTVDGGAQGAITPTNSDTIPDNAVVFGGVINSIVACTSDGSATVAVGTVAGSAANSIKTATAIASLTIDALVVPTCVATPFKMTAAGKINVTVGTADLKTGKVEIWVLYATAAA